MALALNGELGAGGAHNCDQVRPGLVKLVVDYNVIKLGQMRDLLGRIVQALPYRLLVILVPGTQPALQFLHGGWQDEHSHGIGKDPPDLPCALPIDLQDDVGVRGAVSYTHLTLPTN